MCVCVLFVIFFFLVYWRAVKVRHGMVSWAWLSYLMCLCVIFFHRKASQRCSFGHFGTIYLNCESIYIYVRTCWRLGAMNNKFAVNTFKYHHSFGKRSEMKREKNYTQSHIYITKRVVNSRTCFVCRKVLFPVFAMFIRCCTVQLVMSCHDRKKVVHLNFVHIPYTHCLSITLWPPAAAAAAAHTYTHI